MSQTTETCVLQPEKSRKERGRLARWQTFRESSLHSKNHRKNCPTATGGSKCELRLLLPLPLSPEKAIRGGQGGRQGFHPQVAETKPSLHSASGAKWMRGVDPPLRIVGGDSHYYIAVRRPPLTLHPTVLVQILTPTSQGYISGDSAGMNLHLCLEVTGSSSPWASTEAKRGNLDFYLHLAVMRQHLPLLLKCDKENQLKQQV